MKVQIMDEAKEEACGDSTGSVGKPDSKRNRGFNTVKKLRGCVVESCQVDHPPWVCQIFKSLSVARHKEPIAKSGHCFPCLASGHHSRRCSRNIQCGIDGCKSVTHSRYLHDSSKDPKGSSSPSDDGENHSEHKNTTRNQTYTTNQIEKVSLMVLPRFISNYNEGETENKHVGPLFDGLLHIRERTGRT